MFKRFGVMLDIRVDFGEVDKIDELDEDILLFRDQGFNAVNFEQLPALNQWRWIASPNNI